MQAEPWLVTSARIEEHCLQVRSATIAMEVALRGVSRCSLGMETRTDMYTYSFPPALPKGSPRERTGTAWTGPAGYFQRRPALPVGGTRERRDAARTGSAGERSPRLRPRCGRQRPGGPHSSSGQRVQWPLTSSPWMIRSLTWSLAPSRLASPPGQASFFGIQSAPCKLEIRNAP